MLSILYLLHTCTHPNTRRIAHTFHIVYYTSTHIFAYYKSIRQWFRKPFKIPVSSCVYRKNKKNKRKNVVASFSDTPRTNSCFRNGICSTFHISLYVSYYMGTIKMWYVLMYERVFWYFYIHLLYILSHHFIYTRTQCSTYYTYSSQSTHLGVCMCARLCNIC